MTRFELHPDPSVLSRGPMVTEAELLRNEQSNLEDWR